MNKLAALACLLLPIGAFAQSANDTSGAEATPPASTTAAAAETPAQPAPAPEISPEQAARAAAAGELEYAKEMTNPNEATTAEIAAHNATAAPDDRITCKKIKPTGSNRPMKFCSTAKQRREMREASQQAMDSSNVDEIGRRAPGRIEALSRQSGGR